MKKVRLKSFPKKNSRREQNRIARLMASEIFDDGGSPARPVAPGQTRQDYVEKNWRVHEDRARSAVTLNKRY
jgi:hypothetical protein